MTPIGIYMAYAWHMPGIFSLAIPDEALISEISSPISGTISGTISGFPISGYGNSDLGYNIGY